MKNLVLEETPVVAASPVVRVPHERRLLGIALCSLAGVSYGGQALFAKWAYAQGVNTLTVLTMRFVVAALGIWLLVLIMRPSLKMPLGQVGGLAMLGAFFVMNAGFYYISLDLLGAGTAALLGSSFPMWVVLWSLLFFKERLGLQRGVALGLALLGVVLTVDPVTVFTTGEKFSWLGALFAMGSAFSYSFYIILSSRFGRGVPGLVAAAISVPVTALVFCIISGATGQFQWGMTGLGWFYCICLGVGAAAALGAYMIGIQLIGPSRAAIAQTTEPATAVLLGILLLGEPTSLVKLIGGVLIVSAIVLLSRPPRISQK